MGTRNLVQKIHDGTNVIVELKGSGGSHHSHLDKKINNPEKLSDEEVIKLAEENITPEEKLEQAKDVVSKLDGYGISDTSNDDINHGDIVKFELD